MGPLAGRAYCARFPLLETTVRSETPQYVPRDRAERGLVVHIVESLTSKVI